ncbi:Allene oxide synthase [Rhynchospora pubera]|uniref:hydroperoxide dehydratase n=1 Tax=Rhynchospora pubera TaxID=906938 RepID=A0AAV8HRY6_9POAL|nr:Allene oxide synthase [Rhynchospora pubera]
MAKTGNGTAEEHSPSGLPIKQIPGNYGIPVLSPIYDRLHYYYFQGHMGYFKSHATKHNSTVVRLNMPPGIFISRNPHVIAVLDAKSFRVLFDPSKVEKKNTFIGTYVPPLSLYSGLRPMAYLDTTEQLHSSLKSFSFHLLASRKSQFILTFHKAYSSLFDMVEAKIASGPVEFNDLNQSSAFDFTCNAFLGAVPSEVIGPSASNKAAIWLLLQLHPLASRLTKFIPWPIIEDLLLHCVPLPPCLAHGSYKTLEEFFSKAGESLLEDAANKFGLSHDVALHNLIFMTSFNANAGFKIFMPILLKWLAHAGETLHGKLVQEIRSVVKSSNGTITLDALEKMELTKSVVWEALRLDPPVESQFGHARTDLIIESHDTAFRVKKGEMICGYQPMAMRDEKIFKNAEEFVANRFVGDQEKKLLEYVYWSNGPETVSSTVGSKQCPGKDMVILVGRLFVAHLFLRYDTFSAVHDGMLLGLEPRMVFKSVKKASDQ